MYNKTEKVKIGNIHIGGGEPIAIQSMTNTNTTNVDATIAQIHKLQDAGCDIVRVGVPDQESVMALKEIKENISIPLVADIHFNWKLAIESAKFVDKLRINPGTIADPGKVKKIIHVAKENYIPVRIGVNLGSIEKDLEKEFGLSPRAMVESVMRYVRFFEKQNFFNIVLSLKASDVPRTVAAYRLAAKQCNYPLHVGVSEAGGGMNGIIKSSIGIGSLLQQGIGDTIRVSLSDDPVEEVKAGWHILKSLKLRQRGVEITSCPTCARAGIDVPSISKEIEEATIEIKTPIKVAIMGCNVNGPGEAKEADVGVVGAADRKALLYVAGKKVKKISDLDIFSTLLDEIHKKE